MRSKPPVSGVGSWALVAVLAAGLGLPLAAAAQSAPAPQEGRVIDRILAIVSGRLILQSDVAAALRLGLVPVPKEGDRIQGALDRLIERRLMLIEVDRYGPPEPTGVQIDAAVSEIDKRIGSGERLDAILRETGFTLDQLRLYVRDNLRINTYLQQRFGASMSAAEEEILDYYRLHPEQVTRDGALRPFSEVRAQARQALLDERHAMQVRVWLASLRRRTDVNVLYLPGR